MSTVHYDDATHAYTVDGRRVLSVTQVLVEAGLIDPSVFPPGAAERGTAVHLAAQYDDEGALDESSVSDRVAGYLEGWRAFRRDHLTGPWTAIELIVTGDGYAGRLDRIGPVDGVETLVDLKTGRPGRTARLQLAAYNATLDEWLPRLVVQVSADGTYKLHGYGLETQQRDLAVFRAALTIAQWRGGAE